MIMKPKDVVLRTQREHNYLNTNLIDQRDPDMVGSDVSIWHVLLLPVGERVNKAWDAALGVWLIHAPGTNPLYDYYVCVLLHLHSTEGVPEPFRVSKDSAYEVMIATLDPEHSVPNMAKVSAVDGSDGPQICTLDPADFIAQFESIGAGDSTARLVVESMLEEVAAGRLLPDADYRVQWSQALLTNLLTYKEVH